MLTLYIPSCDTDVKPPTTALFIDAGHSWNAFDVKKQTALYLEMKVPHLLLKKIKYLLLFILIVWSWNMAVS